MKRLFAGITSLVTLAFMCSPFYVSAMELDNEKDEIKETLSGYIDVVYPEQTCLLGDTSKLDSIWLQLMIIDDDNNAVALRRFNTKYDEHSCYSVDTSSVDINTPGTYQYTVKSIAGIVETFSVPNDNGDYDYYDVEMTDYEAVTLLTVGDREHVLSLNADELLFEVGNTYNVEIYGYKESDLSFELTDDKVASVNMWLENEAASNYRITANAEGETVLTFSTIDGQTASITICVVPENSIPQTTTAVWKTDNTTTTTAVAKELYFDAQYDYIPVEIGLNTGIELAGYDDDKFYEVGDSPIEFTIDDEQIAKIGIIQGVGVNVMGVSAGETILNAKAPDGRIASIKVVVTEAPSTSTTAVWSEDTTTTTTTTTAEMPATSDNSETLPQTGYSDIYKVITGLATLMTVSGAALVVKTRKENE